MRPLPYLFLVPMFLLSVGTIAIVAAIASASDGAYFEAVALGGVFVLCCYGAYVILRRRWQDRSRGWW